MNYKYGLIGEKLGHSFSPMIFRELGYPEYELVPLPEDKVKEFIRNTSFRGINVTIPYKKLVMDCCHQISEEALAIGCVNALVKDKEGRVTGYNTDAWGMEKMLSRLNVPLSGKKVLILGGGGTSLTARYAAHKMGAGKVMFVSRKGPVTYNDLPAHRDAEVIINTTSVGMYPETDKNLIDLEQFPKCRAVADVIYNPLHTHLLLAAKRRGIAYESGLIMLVGQAFKAAGLFTGDVIDESKVETIYRVLRKQLQNIVLIGMPGSGKSEIGRNAAKSLNKKWVDVDRVIEERYGAIPEVFAREGEGRFRELEEEVIRELSKETNLVLSTGGGSVLNEINTLRLSQNGRIYFINRDLNELPVGAGRPLSVSRERLDAMYRERKPLYEAAADQIIQNDTSIQSAVEKIREDFNEAFDCERTES